ncbi:conserved hypothetical protein [uncultured Eubacteriales bacterium]|uniref:Uncharacterized protein n=1 Tax=uncultured Eubacteriales bacterium TaxID=172733 RepID=A0A212J3Y7_9FIRM|nr:conserved hypothetical protein [uncultured Eubacteriales bacterium]
MLRGELFATDMVRAYQEGRKLHTARPVKPQPTTTDFKWAEDREDIDQNKLAAYKQKAYQNVKVRAEQSRTSKHRPGDYIYCRETWAEYDRLYYRASEPDAAEPIENGDARWFKWRPSIHMPREAARLFFRVTKVEVMRLEDVDEQFALDDGFEPNDDFNDFARDQARGLRHSGIPVEVHYSTALSEFKDFWEQTYGPDARWMWVYWTEPCSREEAMCDGAMRKLQEVR